MARSQIVWWATGENRLVDQTKEQSKTKGSSLRKALFLLMGFSLSSAALWYVFRNIEFSSFKDSWQRIQIVPLVGSVVLYWSALILVRSFLVRYLLHSVGSISAGKAYRYICIGMLSNNILPARMGEVVRTAGISRVSGISFVSVAGAAAIERVLDLAMAALVGMAALAVAPLPSEIRFAIFVTGSVLFVVFALLVFLARRGFKTIPETETRSLKIVLWNLIVRFTQGLEALGTSGGIARALLLSVSIWILVVLVMLLRLMAFGLPPSIPMVLVLVTSLSLGVSLPSAPAYVGVYHVFAVGALTLFGVEENIAVGFAVFCHLTDIIPACVLGAISMLLEGVGFADLKRRPDM